MHAQCNRTNFEKGTVLKIDILGPEMKTKQTEMRG